MVIIVFTQCPVEKHSWAPNGNDIKQMLTTQQDIRVDNQKCTTGLSQSQKERLRKGI